MRVYILRFRSLQYYIEELLSVLLVDESALQVLELLVLFEVDFCEDLLQLGDLQLGQDRAEHFAQILQGLVLACLTFEEEPNDLVIGLTECQLSSSVLYQTLLELLRVYEDLEGSQEPLVDHCLIRVNLVQVLVQVLRKIHCQLAQRKREKNALLDRFFFDLSDLVKQLRAEVRILTQWVDQATAQGHAHLILAEVLDGVLVDDSRVGVDTVLGHDLLHISDRRFPRHPVLD